MVQEAAGHADFQWQLCLPVQKLWDGAQLRILTDTTTLPRTVKHIKIREESGLGEGRDSVYNQKQENSLTHKLLKHYV